MSDRGERPLVSWPVKIAYSTGSIANTVKSRGLSVFLLIFYNQVVGLDPAVVSAVIMLTMICDAVFDPLVGHVSDNLRTRWGRRHPFMYASAIPYPVFFLLLWIPPDWPEPLLAVYLLVVLIGVRLFDTFFELPSSALAPELARDYDERTQLSAIRVAMNSVGSMGFTALALNVFLRERPDGSGGVLARDGYLSYGLAGAAVIFTVILISSLSTHAQIPRLAKPVARSQSFRETVAEVGRTVSNLPFIVLVVSGVLAAASTGITLSLDMYWNLYFFRLSQTQILAIQLSSMMSLVAFSAITPRLARWFGKRDAAIGLFILAVTSVLTPLGLGLAGVMGGAEGLFPILLPLSAVGAGAIGAAHILLAAMTMDVVEQVELKTGRRSEGLLFSADALVKKMTSGFGVLGAGAILSIVAFPTGAERGQVAPEVLQRMACYFIPVKFSLIIAAAATLQFYKLTRSSHEENLRKLRESADATS